MKHTFKFSTQSNQYKVEVVDFVISTNKITCVGDITYYSHNTKIVGVAKGFGFNCSESLMSMLDQVPNIIAEYEKTASTDNIGVDSFESNTNASEYARSK